MESVGRSRRLTPDVSRAHIPPDPHLSRFGRRYVLHCSESAKRHERITISAWPHPSTPSEKSPTGVLDPSLLNTEAADQMRSANAISGFFVGLFGLVGWLSKVQPVWSCFGQNDFNKDGNRCSRVCCSLMSQKKMLRIVWCARAIQTTGNQHNCVATTNERCQSRMGDS